ncbi:MAG: sulfide/dihydroorotate dehydrogenase-like FAD/NAD-binding protein [Rikenellaceae bacterium]
MFEILEKKILAESIVEMRIKAPRIAKSAHPGQFIIVRESQKSERIPLTIADYDAEQEWITIVIQTIGLSTKRIATLNQGDMICDVAGPLGLPSEFIHESQEKLRGEKFLFVAGGLGAAPVYPQVKWLHSKGCKVDVIIGAKSSELVIYKEQMSEVCDNLYVCTDDGSEGFKGLVTSRIEQLIDVEGKSYDHCVAIGPMIMMKFTSLTTAKYNLHTIVSLNTLMVDGTGMCGACRVTVDGKTRFACVEGPEFDGHKVDYDEALQRMGMYRSSEAKAMEAEHDHKCKIGLH